MSQVTLFTLRSGQPYPLPTGKIVSQDSPALEMQKLSPKDSSTDHIRSFWMEPRALDIGTKIITWNLGELLQKLVTYFFKNFKGTEVKLTSGIDYLAGKEHWKSLLLEKLQLETLENFPEMWSFCTQPPACFELKIKLPFQTLSKEEFQTFLDFGAFLIAIQVLPERFSYVEAMIEFGRVRHSAEGTAERLEMMNSIKSKSELTCHVQEGNPVATMKVPLSSETSFKITFSFSSPSKPETHSEYLALYSQEDELPRADLVCGLPPSLEIVYEQIHRLGLSWATGFFNSNDRKAESWLLLNAFRFGCRSFKFDQDGLMFYYFNLRAHDIDIPSPPKDKTLPQTLLGLFLHSHLVVTPRPFKEVCAALTLANHFHEGADFPIEIPGNIQAALELLCQRVKDNKSNLSFISEALKAVCPTVPLEMGIERLIASEDNKTSSSAWQLWEAGIEDSRSRFDSLQRLCPTLTPAALPAATAKAQDLCRTAKDTVQPASQVQLLSGYLDRLIQKSLSEHAPALVESLNGLVVNSQLLQQVLPYRHAVGHLARQSNQLSSLLTHQLNEAWKKFQEFQKKPQMKFWDEMLGNLETYGPLLTSQKGFALFFEWVAKTLKNDGKYQRILSLLHQIPVEKGDRIFHKWYESSLEHVMKDKKVRFEAWATELAYFRTTKAVALAPLELLLQLLEHLLKISNEDKKTQEAKFRHELSFLIDQIRPEQRATPRFLTCLHGYYPALLDLALLGQLYEDLVKNFPVLKADLRACALLVSSVEILKKTKDTKLWEKFTTCLEQFKKESKFNDTVLSIYESLTHKDFFARDLVFKNEWAAFEKRLSESQRARLAQVVLALYQHSAATVSYYPSTHWLLTLIQRKETWESYTAIYLDLATKRKIELFAPPLLKIGAHLLTEKDLAAFGKLVVRIPQTQFRPDAAEWKPILAKVISRLPTEPFILDLLNILIGIAAPEEKHFLEEVKSLRAEPERLKSAMINFPTTRVIPPSERRMATAAAVQALTRTEVLLGIQDKLDGILSELMTPQELEKILAYLEDLPEGEVENWEKLFNSLHKNVPKPLLLRIWKTWVKKHPLEQVRPQDGKYWLLAIDKVLRFYPKSDPVDEFLAVSPEKGPDLLDLLGRLEGDECKKIFVWFYERGIGSCWENGNRLKELYHFTKMQPLINKFGTSPLLLLDPIMQLRLSLLLASHTTPSVRLDGQSHFFRLTRDAVSSYRPESLDLNEQVFATYCERPFVPEDLDVQRSLYQWIGVGLARLPALSWDSAATLIPALCRFDGRVEIDLPGDIVMKWQLITQKIAAETAFGAYTLPDLAKLLLEPAAAGLPAPNIPTDDFLKATGAMLGGFLALELPSENKQRLLQTIGEGLERFQNQFLGISRLTPLWVPYMVAVLSDVQDAKSVFIVVKHIGLNLPSVRNIDDARAQYQHVTNAFASSIHQILALAAGDAKFIDQVMSTVQTLGTFPQFLNDDKQGWLSLLLNMMGCIHEIYPQMDKEHSKLMLRAIILLFGRCANPQLVMKISTLVYYYKDVFRNDQDRLIFYTSKVLALFLGFSELDCLDPQDWSALFENLTAGNLHNMMDQCLETNNTDALLRIIRYAKPLGPEFLENLLDVIKVLNVHDSVSPISLSQSISSLIKTYKSTARPDQMKRLMSTFFLLLDRNFTQRKKD